MIESIEAIVGRHQAETASRDGRDEAMDASKFRKILGALVKGRSSHDTAKGSLQDLMSALVVEPLPVARAPKEAKKSDDLDIGAPSEEKPVKKAESRKEEDSSAQADTTNQVAVAPVDDVTPMAVSPVRIEKEAFGVSPTAEKADGGSPSTVQQLQAEVQPEIRPDAIPDVRSKEIDRAMSQKEAKSQSVAFTPESAVPLQQIENAVVSQEPIASTKTGEPKTPEEPLSTDDQNPVQVAPAETSDDLPVVEGLLQLRALIERVSKGIGGIENGVSGAQGELVNSIEGSQDSGLSALSAAKENPGSKAVPNVVGEKSNEGVHAGKEKTTLIPERMLPKMMEKLEQVAREVERSKDGRSISLRLDPPQLGKVRVDMTMKDGSIHTRLTAESELVAHFLRERGDELQALIRKALPHLDQATLSFGESSTGNHFGQQMKFGGDSFQGFLDNRGSGGSEGGNRGSDSGSGENGKIKERRTRHESGGSGEHWVA